MKMIEKGVGDYQISKTKKARNKILEILSDGKMHRYGEIVKKTGLSTATVTKHLKELEKEGYVIKHVDLESGEYPYPALYKISAEGQSLREKEIFKEEIDRLRFKEIEISEEHIKKAAETGLGPGFFKLFLDKVKSKPNVKIPENFSFVVKVFFELMTKDFASKCSIKFLMPEDTPPPIDEANLLELFESLFLTVRKFDKDKPLHIILSYNPKKGKKWNKEEITKYFEQKGIKDIDVKEFYEWWYSVEVI